MGLGTRTINNKVNESWPFFTLKSGDFDMKTLIKVLFVLLIALKLIDLFICGLCKILIPLFIFGLIMIIAFILEIF